MDDGADGFEMPPAPLFVIPSLSVGYEGLNLRLPGNDLYPSRSGTY